MTVEPVTSLPNSLDLEKFALDASQIHGIAKALATTSFVPKVMQGRPDEITAAVLFGREVGLTPMVSLQSINVIEGRPSLTALAMRGLAQKAGVKFRLEESNSTRCRMSARGPTDEIWTESLWTTDRAKQLGLTSKSNWVKQPTAMLIARATSELCRLVAAQVFLGYPYSSEELKDGAEDERYANGTAAPSKPDDPTPEPSTKRTFKRNKPVPAEVTYPAPDFEREPEPEPSPPAPDGFDRTDVPQRELSAGPNPTIDIGVRKALMAAFNEVGMSERAARLAYVSDVVGREVHSVNQISTEEGKAILDRLHGREDEQGWPVAAEVPDA